MSASLQAYVTFNLIKGYVDSGNKAVKCQRCHNNCNHYYFNCVFIPSCSKAAHWCKNMNSQIPIANVMGHKILYL